MFPVRWNSYPSLRVASNDPVLPYHDGNFHAHEFQGADEDNNVWFFQFGHMKKSPVYVLLVVGSVHTPPSCKARWKTLLISIEQRALHANATAWYSL